VAKRRRTIEAVVAHIEAIALEHPSARWARVFSGFASQIGDLGRRLSYRPRYRRIAWPRFLDALRGALTHRYLWALAATVGVVLAAPVIGRGWGMTDDVLQRQAMLSSTLSEALSAQFEFLHPARNAELMDLGAIPWWTLEGVRVAFFRPLSTLTHWLDYQLWPNSDGLMHAHNVLWYGGLCALVVVFYRRFLGHTPTAGLAALLFAGSVAHLSGLGSIAGRNVLIVAAGLSGGVCRVLRSRDVAPATGDAGALRGCGRDLAARVPASGLRGLGVRLLHRSGAGAAALCCDCLGERPDLAVWQVVSAGARPVRRSVWMGQRSVLAHRRAVHDLRGRDVAASAPTGSNGPFLGVGDGAGGDTLLRGQLAQHPAARLHRVWCLWVDGRVYRRAARPI